MKTNLIIGYIAFLVLVAEPIYGQNTSTSIDSQFLSTANTNIAALSESVSNISVNVSNLSYNVSNLLTNVTNAAPIWSKYFHSEAGITVLNPFTISQVTTGPNTYELKVGSPQLRGIIQGILEDRYAWRHDYYPGPYGYSKPTNGEPVLFTTPFGGTTNFQLAADFEVELGYAYGASGSQSSVTGGSGDFFGSMSLGWDTVTYWHGHAAGKLPFVWTVGPEGFMNFASDDQYSQIHTAEGGGVAYTAGIPWVSQTKLQFKTRIGYAAVDSPYISGEAADGNLLVSSDGPGGLPKFYTKGAVDIQAELRVPINLSNNQFGYLSFGGEAYKFTGKEPDQWSMYMALSIDLNALEKTVLGVIQGQTPTE